MRLPHRCCLGNGDYRESGLARCEGICEKRLGVSKRAPHDLRRSCARLCHESGGELEQIQFLLGHVSVQTTEKYLGCKQRFREAVNDRLGIEPTPCDLVSIAVKFRAVPSSIAAKQPRAC